MSRGAQRMNLTDFGEKKFADQMEITHNYCFKGRFLLIICSTVVRKKLPQQFPTSVLW